MKTLLTTLTTVALLSAATTTLARPGGGLLRMDADGDGQISREEFQPPAQHKERRGPFARADSNNDGVVTRAEVESVATERQQHMLAMFDSMDTDGNGSVTPQEAQDHMFSRLDANNDGFVTEEEARAMHAKRRERRGKWGEGDSDA